MRLPVLDFTKVSQILRADVEFFIHEQDLEAVDIQSSLDHLIAVLDPSTDGVDLFLIGISPISAYSYKVVSGQSFIYTLKLFLEHFQDRFQCFSSIYKMYILAFDGGIHPCSDFASIAKVSSDKLFVSQVVEENLEQCEALVEVVKSHLSKSVIAFELKRDVM